MLIKGLVCLSILIFTTTIGYLFASKYRNRKVFFLQFYQFNEGFLRELEYMKRPLRQFIESCVYKGDFLDILQRFLENLGDYELFLSNFPEIGYINNEEMRLIDDYFNSLGRGDTVTQRQHFSNLREVIGSISKKCELEYKKYGDLYIKMGVLIGLAIIVVIL